MSDESAAEPAPICGVTSCRRLLNPGETAGLCFHHASTPDEVGTLRDHVAELEDQVSYFEDLAEENDWEEMWREG